MIFEKSVSVIVPMYNVEGLIGETIENLMSNRLDIEFLLIDDGSEDKTYEVAREICQGDNRFKILKKTNSGVSDTRNFGLSLAKGQYICFLDSDDILSEGGIDDLFSIASTKNIDFLYFQVKRFSNGKSWISASHENHKVFVTGKKDITINKELFWALGIGGKFIRRDLLNEINFPLSIEYGEDAVFMLKALVLAKNVFLTTDITYYYRERDLALHQPSATQLKKTKSNEYLYGILKCIDMCSEFIRSNISDEDKRNKVLRFYMDRIFSFEVRTLLLQSVGYKDTRSKDGLRLAKDYVYKLSEKDIQLFAAIRYFFIRVFMDHLHKLRAIDFFIYRDILLRIFSSLDEGFYKKYDKDSFYDGRWSEAKKFVEKNKSAAFLYFLKLAFVKRSKNFALKRSKEFYKYSFVFFKLFPIKKDKVIFASSKDKPLSANLKSLVAFSRAEGYDVFTFFGKTTSFKKNLFRNFNLATAKYIFLEDYYSPIYGLNFKADAKVIQIWHAAGAFKKFGHSAIGSVDSNSGDFEKNAHASYTDVFVSGPEMRAYYAEAFGISIDKVKDLGVPRTDLFFNKRYIKNSIEKIEKTIKRDKNNILYLPTFRGRPNQRSNFELPFNWNDFDASFFDKNRILIKVHPVVKNIKNLPPEELKNKVIILGKEFETDELMIFSDSLITDYSSVIFDYSLLKKPIIHYVYDINDYYDERGFYFPFEKYTYGPVIFDSKGLVNAIEKSNFSDEMYQVTRQKFIDYFMKSCDGASTKRVVEHVFEK